MRVIFLDVTYKTEIEKDKVRQSSSHITKHENNYGKHMEYHETLLVAVKSKSTKLDEKEGERRVRLLDCPIGVPSRMSP